MEDNVKDNTMDDNLQLLRGKMSTEAIASFLNMQVIELKPGYARVKMHLLPEYQNFNGSIFGGIIMSLADYAFGYTANSLAYPSVASQFNIYFLKSKKNLYLDRS